MTLIKFAPLVTVDSIRDPRSLEAGRTLYRGLKFMPRVDSVPLLVDHDDDREIGVVHELFEFPDTDGLWLAARCTVTSSPPAWLKRRTRASFGFVRRSEQEIPGWCRVQRGYVTEVSVLSPGVEPAEPRAQVSLLTSSPAAAPSSDRAAVDGTLLAPGRIVRRNIG